MAIELEIFKLYREISNLGADVIISWIKGYSGIEGNIVAEKLAKSTDSSSEICPIYLLPVSDIDAIEKIKIKKYWIKTLKHTVTGNNFIQY